MIVRILGEGQFDVPEATLERLNALDAAIESAVAEGDQVALATALDALHHAVRSSGSAHDPGSLDESDLILPPAGASVDEVRELLGDEGLIPG